MENHLRNKEEEHKSKMEADTWIRTDLNRGRNR